MTVRIATSNVYVELDNAGAAKALDQVLATDPQILGLQEWSRSRRKILRKKARVVLFPATARHLRKRGLARAYPAAGMVFAYPALGGQPVGVDAGYGEILSARRILLAKRRGKVRATYGTEVLIRVHATGQLRPVLNLHLLAHHDDPDHAAGWAEGRQSAIDWVESWAGFDALVMGDTNKDLMDLPPLVSCWVGNRHPGTLHGRSIDNIYARSKAGAARTIRTPSDHDAAVADYPEEP